MASVFFPGSVRGQLFGLLSEIFFCSVGTNWPLHFPAQPASFQPFRFGVRAQRGVMSLGSTFSHSEGHSWEGRQKVLFVVHTKYSPAGCSSDKPAILPSTLEAHISQSKNRNAYTDQEWGQGADRITLRWLGLRCIRMSRDLGLIEMQAFAMWDSTHRAVLP